MKTLTEAAARTLSDNLAGVHASIAVLLSGLSKEAVYSRCHQITEHCPGTLLVDEWHEFAEFILTDALGLLKEGGK